MNLTVAATWTGTGWKAVANIPKGTLLFRFFGEPPEGYNAEDLYFDDAEIKRLEPNVN